MGVSDVSYFMKARSQKAFSFSLKLCFLVSVLNISKKAQVLSGLVIL